MPLLSIIVVLAFAFASWSLYSVHQQACSGRDKTLDAVQDIVVIATTPDPGQHVSAEDMRRMLAFRSAVTARLNSARC